MYISFMLFCGENHPCFSYKYHYSGDKLTEKEEKLYTSNINNICIDEYILYNLCLCTSNVLKSAFNHIIFLFESFYVVLLMNMLFCQEKNLEIALLILKMGTIVNVLNFIIS